MSKKLFRLCSKTTLICLEALAVVVGLVVLSGSVLLWRLTTGPIDVAFAKGYIQDALYDPVSGYGVRLGTVVLEWPDLQGPLMLNLRDVSLLKEGQSVFTVGRVDLGLSGRSLLSGQVKPVTIILAEPALRLIRTENNDIRLGMQEEFLSSEADTAVPTQSPLMRIVEVLSQPQGTVDSSSLIDHLRSLEIQAAKMIMEDHVLGMTWYLQNLDLSFARDKQGLVVTAGIQVPGGRDGSAEILLDVVYDRERKDFRTNVHVQDFNPHILSRKLESLAWLDEHQLYLSGNIEAVLDSSLNLRKAGLSLFSTQGALSFQGVYDEPVPFERLELDATYDEADQSVDIKALSLTAGGVSFLASSRFALNEGDIKIPLAITIDDLPQDKIKPLWPDVLRGKSVELWLTERMSVGRVHDVSVLLDMALRRVDGAGRDGWSADIADIKADFQIENMTVDYQNPLLPATNIHGQGRYDYISDVLTVDITEAKISDLSITKGRLLIDHIVKEGTGTADINVDLKGPLKTLFGYISSEPIAMDEEELGFETAGVQGGADLHVNVSFPAIKELLKEQVAVKAQGTLNDVVLPGVVRGLDLKGGPLTLDVADGRVILGGRAKLKGRDVKLNWEQYLESEGKPYASKIIATLKADKALREHFGIELDDWLDGVLPVEVTYTEFADDRAEASVKADVTPVRLMVKPLAFEKPSGVKGTATCKAVMKGGDLQEIKDLNVESTDLRMKNGRFIFKTAAQKTVLREGTVSRIVVGETDMDLDFEVGRNGSLKMKMNGSFLDARPFLDKKKNKGSSDGPALTASINVSRMRTHPARLIEKAKIYIDMGRDGFVNQLEMDAVAGKGDVYLRLKPNDAGKMALRLEADDAGAVLQAFGVYENVRDGKLVIHAESADAKKRSVLSGNALLSDFTVVNAPVLARLLNAISPIGLVELLGDEGIYFSSLESDFDWYIRREGDFYVLNDGRTSGASLGLTFEGEIDKSKESMDLKGHIVPVSTVNSLLSGIPLIGAILTGGDEGAIFAATYTVKGESKDPDISVNPLSVLAPGIFRRLLFED